jgi:hypothetical protein
LGTLWASTRTEVNQRAESLSRGKSAIKAEK